MIGSFKYYGGQQYECVGEQPYTRRDGSQTYLAVWETRCATCNCTFRFKYSTNSEKFEPNRRCKDHKRPGAKVKHERAGATVKAKKPVRPSKARALPKQSPGKAVAMLGQVGAAFTSPTGKQYALTDKGWKLAKRNQA